MSLRLAVHWTAVTSTAAVTSLAAAIPFTGTAASTIGALAATGVCAVGIALAPAPTRKDGRS
jgi:hypothetical protein